MTELLTQFVNLLGAVLLMLAFAMTAQRRILSLIHLFTLQGATLVLSTAVVGYVTNQPHLYLSAAVTGVLKVGLIPWLLHRVVDRLGIRSEVETLINIQTTMLIGIGVVIFSFNLAKPIAQLSTTLAGGTLGIALDVLIGVLILGVFMFQIREQFDSLDIRHLEKLKED